MFHQGRQLSYTIGVFSSKHKLAVEKNSKRSGVGSPASMGV